MKTNCHPPNDALSSASSKREEQLNPQREGACVRDGKPDSFSRIGSFERFVLNNRFKESQSASRHSCVPNDTRIHYVPVAAADLLKRGSSFSA